MHRISYLHIRNFRACQDVSLPLERYTPLVGQNNTGKSTILEAIRWGLKPTALKGIDFADASQSIVVTLCITGITSTILDLIPEQKHRTAIAPYCEGQFLWIRTTATKPGAKGFTKEIYNHKAYSGDGSEMPSDGMWRKFPTGLPGAVSALLPEPLFIEAMDDVGEDLGKVKAGTTIKSLLDEIMEPVLKAHNDLNQALNTISEILTTDGANRSRHLKDFDEHATSTLEQFFPGLTLDLDLQMINIKEFFKAGHLHVTDTITGDRRRFDQMGTGAQRAIQMALIRYLAQVRISSQENSACRLLLIDEPELYLHPQGVRRLRQALHGLSKVGFQVIFSTHSPLMLNRDNAADTVIISKNKEKGVLPKKPLRQAVQTAISNGQAQSRTLFELGNIAEIYFSDRVVLCEGKTDRRLLPLAYEQIYEQPLELEHTTVVSLGSCDDIPKALSVLKAMNIKACAVADLDFAFVGARKGSASLLPKNDQEIDAAKDIIQRIQPNHGFAISGNGYPQNKGEWKASEVWALFAKEDDGKEIAQTVHDQLKAHNIWVWPRGCIEDVTGTDSKGEEAIIDQEEQLRAMSAEEIKEQMPAFTACFEWIRGL